MKNIFRISSVILIIFFLNHSCKKDSTGQNIGKTTIDKYVIEMNSAYRISRVTHFSSDNGLIYDRMYSYSDTEVVVHDFVSGNFSTYFLNNDGLADSSTDGSNRIKYSYNSDKYLISYYQHSDLDTLIYENGNRTYVANFPLHGNFFKYNSLLNLIDIESFQGPYLGKLNKNLVSEFTDRWGQHGNETTNTVYEYKLKDLGLVIQRTGLSTNEYHPGSGPNPTEKLITNFEYINKK